MRSHLDNARPLPALLRHLAESNLVPDEGHKAAVLRAAEALEQAMPDNPARVVIHAGGGVDPVLQSIEAIEEEVREMARRCYELGDEVRSYRDDLQRAAGA